MFGNKAIKSTLVATMLTIAGLTLSFQANAACKLVSTKDGSPLAIKAVDTDTPEAKQFLETCVNPYTKMYMADAEAAKKGQREYNYNNCTGCHGGKLEGIMAPSLSKNSKGGQGAFDQKWVYAKKLPIKVCLNLLQAVPQALQVARCLFGITNYLIKQVTAYQQTKFLKQLLLFVLNTRVTAKNLG